MPGFDRTGPLGVGPRPGWRRGLCGTDLGKGMRRGGAPWGGGRGRRFGGQGTTLGLRPFIDEASQSASQEAEALKAQLAAAKDEIAAMMARLEELAIKE